ncbi:MAG TPA: T9SS type A sorting domain-containing protein, partial [Saprospiraceae bacterium]|nr:T9SS type A sorting domain-containing protein [Saprospiraceae bacterium]
GGASGSAFPLGTSTVCYRADDACGHSASCCFTVEVQSVEDACDTKISGCIKFELLGVQRDGALNWVYRVRVTNNCSAELQYVYLQVPDGLTAFSPANNAIYTAPSGRSYLARNPNYSPMYSVRFKSQGTGIAGGESDVFRYALPQQADVDYINVGVRLSSGLYYETHLNTFGCPVTTELNPRPAAERQYSPANGAWRVYPNPAAPGALLHLEGPALDNAVFALRDAAGRLVWEGPVTDQSVSLGDAALPGGVYGFRITSNGQWVSSGKLVVLR